jgi:Tfp pilus assembly protein PilO
MEQLTINITPEAKAALQQRAAANGQDIKDFVEQMVNQQALRPTLDELLAPVRQDFADSGMTEDELDEFLEEVREEVWQEKQSRKR